MDIDYKAARITAEILEQSGFEAFIIGGAVRDLLLAHDPQDFDIVTDATPDQIKALTGFEKIKHTDPAQAYGVTRLVIDIDGESAGIDLTTYRKDIDAHLGRKDTAIEFADLWEDVHRRDITINALALDPATNMLVDLVDGLTDLENKLIRFIGDPQARIAEDPLRVIRTIRFKNRFGFSYDEQTELALRQAIAEGVLSQIATDRLRDELTKILRHTSRQDALYDLDQLGALQYILPELTDTKGTPQPRSEHSEGDVFTHSLLATHYLPEDASETLVWATLLHDIGKDDTYQSAEETGDRIRFSEHYKVGAQEARGICERLGFSKQKTATIEWLIHYHMAIGNIPEMSQSHVEHHYFSDPRFPELLELHRADAHAAWNARSDGSIDISAPDLSHLEHMYDEFKKKQAEEDYSPPSLKDLGVDGNWLKEHGYTSGEEIGKALKLLEEQFHLGRISSKKDALKTLNL